MKFEKPTPFMGGSMSQLDYVHTKECIVHNGKVFELIDTFKQTGYCAKHIGSRLNEIRQSRKEPLIVNLPKNRRLVFASVEV